MDKKAQKKAQFEKLIARIDKNLSNVNDLIESTKIPMSPYQPGAEILEKLELESSDSMFWQNFKTAGP